MILSLRDSSRSTARMILILMMVAFAIMTTRPLHAQSPNIALATTPCTASHSGGGSGYPGCCGPENYNDGQYGSYFGWVTTSGNPDPNAWIQFDWGTAAKSPGQITLFYVSTGTRYLQSGTIQYWSGSAWVNHFNFSFTNINLLTQVITFPSVTTTKIRITNMTTVGSQASNPNFYEIEIRETIQGTNNAGITALTSPLNFCPGSYPVIVNLTNSGFNQITSCTIKWTLNGAPQPDYAWTGMLDTLNGTTRNTLVTLNPAYNFLTGIPYTFKIWSSNPNGQPDPIVANDTLTTTRGAAMAGTFTIGGASPSYPNFSSAVAALNTNGLCGPVVFNVRSGAYNEQVNLGTISGASATNTITFQSETGNRADVTLSYAATTSAAGSATVLFNGTDFATFRNMTIVSTGASYGYTLYFQSGCDYNRIINCNIRTVNSTSSSFACIYSPSGSVDNYNEFRDNLLEYGYYSVYWYGSSTTALDTRTIFDNNTFLNFYYYGLLMYYQDAPQLTRNVVQTNSTTTNYGMYMYYNYNDRYVSGNKFNFTGSGYKYAMMNYYCIGTPSLPGLVTNNFVTLGSNLTGYYPAYIYYNQYNNYYNNSFYNGSTTTSYYGAYVYYGNDVKLINNIFYHANQGYSIYCVPGTNVTASNYNLYYTTGATLAYWNGTAANIAALRALTGRDQNSVSAPVNFANPNAGDLHLVGASQDDPLLTGTMLPEVTTDIDGEPRARPYIGADEGCYITPGAVSFDITDASGTPVSYFNYPGTIYVKYNIAFPATAFTATITLNFYTVPGNALAYTTSFTVNKSAGLPATGVQAVSVPGMASGYYRIEGVFNTKNSCDLFTTFKPGDRASLGLGQGQVPCIVWPGDVTNNGVVDYGDRSGLNKYIQMANLSPLWLTGPARYRPDFATNPFTYYTWEGQAAAPWNTPDGCYMDADGNGMVNSFDYIPIRVNWLKTHGAPPKSSGAIQAGTFDMVQNYPNPFNPTTSISYSVPEHSQVRLVVTDMLGRTVATLVNGSIESGVHSATFDASTLNSGQYIATVNMIGESGMTFTKTIKMTLAK